MSDTPTVTTSPWVSKTEVAEMLRVTRQQFRQLMTCLRAATVLLRVSHDSRYLSHSLWAQFESGRAAGPRGHRHAHNGDRCRCRCAGQVRRSCPTDRRKPSAGFRDQINEWSRSFLGTYNMAPEHSAYILNGTIIVRPEVYAQLRRATR